ncbi:hypothetical protein BX285_4739 [Streptomyces sp. 1114.5]|uniref:hypothetical protein n=1 Tax=Streptomyces sp. 1114.5 TaxID=1938830 RepID=UPI000F19E9FE|nr:hypothetical protein [Streptomyces sp. 1114.5]RKT10814.1 hypothetical protein BX285_4739 [Streptomyces sp. 1114.5]
MRRDVRMRPSARIRARARLLLRARRPVRPVLAAVAAGFAWWLLIVRGQLADGAALGLLAAGGWGLGLIPVHADRNATGPARRRPEETVRPVEAQPPQIG